MPPLQKRRRGPAPDEDEEDEEPTQTQRRQRRRDSTPREEEAYGGEERNGIGNTQGDKIEKRARKLVRYALACEFSRQPIRRTEVVKKVMDDEGKDFRAVFAEAQIMLAATFGMAMKELPSKEKVSVRDRRAEAAKTAKQAASTTSAWVLVSSLPRAYRDPVILPAQDPTYVALYTFIITSIMLSSGVMEEGKFERCLQRVNANDYTPLGTKDKLLQRLIKEAYIVKIKDNSGGEEKIEYMVGPRGKVEVDKHAVANVLRTVFGENEEDLEKRIEKSLNLGDVKASVPAQINENANANGAAEGSGTQRRTSTRASRRQTVGEDEEEEEDEDSDE